MRRGIENAIRNADGHKGLFGGSEALKTSVEWLNEKNLTDMIRNSIMFGKEIIL